MNKSLNFAQSRRYLFGELGSVFSLSSLGDLEVDWVAHQGQTEERDDQSGEPENHVRGESGRQKEETVEDLDQTQIQLTRQVQFRNTSQPLTVMSSLKTIHVQTQL